MAKPMNMHSPSYLGLGSMRFNHPSNTTVMNPIPLEGAKEEFAIRSDGGPFSQYICRSPIYPDNPSFAAFPVDDSDCTVIEVNMAGV